MIEENVKELKKIYERTVEVDGENVVHQKAVRSEQAELLKKAGWKEVGANKEIKTKK